MNTTLTRIGLALGGALFAGAALAGGGNHPIDHVRSSDNTSTKTRAEVRAELQSKPSLIRGDVYPVIERTPAERSREEVRTEARAHPVRVTA